MKIVSRKSLLLLPLFLMAAASGSLFAQSPILNVVSQNYANSGSTPTVRLWASGLAGTGSGSTQVCFTYMGTIGAPAATTSCQTVQPDSNMVTATVPAVGPVQTGSVFLRVNYSTFTYNTNSLQFIWLDPATCNVPITGSACPVGSSLTPSQIVVGSGDTALSINGTGFAPPIDVGTAQAYFAPPGGSPQLLTPTAVSNTRVDLTVPSSLLTAAGTGYFFVSVGGKNSNPLPFNIVPPSITSVSPTFGVLGTSPTLTLTGNFPNPTTGAASPAVGFSKPGATGPATITPTSATATNVVFTVPAAQMDTLGAASILIGYLAGRTPTTSNSVSFSIVSPPTISSLSPNAAVAGGPTMSVTLNGSNLNIGGAPTVQWINGNVVINLVVTASSATAVTVTVPSSLLTAAGSASIGLNTGGYASNAAAFTVYPPPVLQSIFSDYIYAGSGQSTISLYGTGFTGGGTLTARFTANNVTTNLVTTPGTDNYATAVIPANLLVNSGTATISVTKGGVASSGVTLTIVPSPVITSLNPRGISAGSADFTLTVTGQNFQGVQFYLPVVNFGSTVLYPANSSATTLTVTVPAALVATAGNVPVTVEMQQLGGAQANLAPSAAVRRMASTSRNVAEVGTLSNVVNFSVLGTLSITSTFPTWIQSGSSNTQLTVTGTNFDNGSVVLFNGTQVPTVYNSPTQLTATVPASLLTTVGDRPVVVRDSFSRNSNTWTLPVIPPIIISSLTPPYRDAGSAAFTLTVNGSGFEQGNIVVFETTQLATTFVSANQLTATVPSNLLTTVGIYGIAVRDQRGRVSSSAVFNVVPPLVLSSTSPVRANSGVPGFTLNVAGQGFVTGSVIRFNGAPIPTTIFNSTSASGSVPANLVVSPGVVDVLVQAPDGRVSNSLSFTLLQPLLITSLNPPGASSGASTLTLTVTGQGFAPESVVRMNGLGLLTTFVSETQLTAIVSDTILSGQGPLDVTVANPGGAVSNALPFGLGGGSLLLTNVTPASAPVNSTATPIIVTGRGFAAGTVLKFGQTEIPTQVASPTQLSGTIPAQLLTTAGTFQITASLGSTTSNALTFQVGNAPEITSLSPNQITAGASRFTLVVLGRGFVSGATIKFGDQDLTTTFVAATQLSASVSADLVAAARTVPVTVTNPDGTTSNSADFRILTLSLTSITPDKAAAGSAAITLALEGTGFIQGASVSFGGTGLVTSFGGATRLSATVPASALTTPGVIQVTVSNPDGAKSNAVTFTIESDTPSISRLNPASVVAGSGEVTVNVIGGGFVRGSSVTAGGQSLSTSFNSATSLDAVVPAGLTSTIRTLQFKVTNPGNKESNEVGFQVTAPTPAITRINPASVNAGTTTDVTIAVTGTGFVQGSSVQFNGSGIETSFDGPTSLSAVIPASALTTPGNATVRVSNPGDLLSNAVQFQILGPLSVTAVSPSTIVAGGTQNITLGVTGVGFVNGSSVSFNGNTLATTFNSATSLSAVLPPSLTATAGTFSVSVSNPNGATSNSVSVKIDEKITPPPLNLQVPAVITPAGNGRVQVTLDGNAPVTLTGTLVLTFTNNSNNAPNGYVDPALVFAGTGSRTITFTIPAGTQNAVIPGDGAFSPGTVAGTIVVTMTSLTGGGQNLLPDPAPVRNIVVDRTVPVIVAGSVKITNIAGGFQVELSGISSVRDLRSINYSFTSSGTSILEGTSVTVDVSQLFTTYFGSAAGQQSGGAFKFTMPFTVTGGDANAVTQVTVTLTNSVGTSVAVTGGR